MAWFVLMESLMIFPTGFENLEEFYKICMEQIRNESIFAK